MMRSRTFAVLSALVGSAALVPVSSAALVASFDTQSASAPAPATFTPTYAVSATDQLNGLSPSAMTGTVGAFSLETSGGLPVLTDGQFQPINSGGTGAHPAFATAGDAATAGMSVTYTLTGPPKNLTQIDVYGGWNDNGRDQLNFTVEVSTNGTTFTALAVTPNVDSDATGSTNAPDVAAGLQIAHRVSITDNAAANIATNVQAIRFNFGAVENGYTGYAELDVFGTNVPEPGSLGALVLGSVGLLARRRRRGA